MTIFILIMVLGGDRLGARYASQSGYATIQQEFNSFENCEAARKHILDNRADKANSKVHVQGCFKK